MLKGPIRKKKCTNLIVRNMNNEYILKTKYTRYLGGTTHKKVIAYVKE